MKQVVVAALLAVAAVAPAHAQIAAAIGKPLPSPDLPPNSLSVRVVAGTPSSPVIGVAVTLVVNGAPRVARTDSAGRAQFQDLPPGAQLQAKALDDDKQEVASETFQLPADSGARLMLTTRPWNPGAGGGAPMAGGAMPNPRQMSGEPRPEQTDPPGTFTVRLTYDDFKDAPPVDIPVALVGYSAAGEVTFAVRRSDPEGRARFDGLDRTGATSYFAMTQLPRGSGIDRLFSTPAVLDARTGARLILSSEKRASTAPALDDLTKLDKQDGAPPAGKVRVTLDGGPDSNALVMLVDAQTKLVVGRAKPAPGPPDPSQVQGGAQFDAKPDVPAGMVRVRVHGGVGTTDEPLANIGVRLVLASAQDAGSDDAEHRTNPGGIVELATSAHEPVTAVITINGKQLRSRPFELATSGGELEVQAHWPSQGRPEVMFDLVPRPGQVVYAETDMHRQHYRSLPFQPLADRGTQISLFIFPRVLVSFSLTSRIDDEYFAVNGRFEVSNNSWAPYVGGPDGMLLPLPKGFVGGLVAESDQDEVAISPGEGFRIIRPIAPGRFAFHGAFSLPVEHGVVRWDLDLPFGSYNSGMEILKVPGMNVHTPDGVESRTVEVAQGTFVTLPNISILPRQAMVMTIEGLPQPPAWRVWLPRIFGIIVVLVIATGLWFALRRKQPDPAAHDARRQQLLDELVELEASGKDDGRREQVMAELEQRWDDAG